MSIASRHFTLFLIVGGLISAGTLVRGADLPIVREAGVLYLGDADAAFGEILLDVLEPTAVFSDSKGSRHLGVLRFPQKVRLLAVGPALYRVQGQAAQGQVVGWVQPLYLSPLHPDFVEQVRKSMKRKAEVDELIKRREVAIGMTMEEVERSIGRPQRISSRANAETSVAVWEYIVYKTVPQQVQGRDALGRLVWITEYVKVPAGSRSVSFQEGVVSELSVNTENPERGVRQILPPFRQF